MLPPSSGYYSIWSALDFFSCGSLWSPSLQPAYINWANSLSYNSSSLKMNEGYSSEMLLSTTRLHGVTTQKATIGRYRYKSCILLGVQNSSCTKWLDCSAHVTMLNCIGIKVVWWHAYLNTFQVWNTAGKLHAPNIIRVVIYVLLGTFSDTLSGGTHMDET
jgi:hypothetical protein